MRSYIRLLAAASFAALIPVKTGAQVIDPTVEVVRNYNVSLGEIFKPTIPSGIDDSITVFERNFDYSIFNRPYSNLYEFTPYDAIRLDSADVQRYPFFTARAGCQYPVMPTLELQFQKVTRKGLNFSLFGRHNSFWGDVPSAIGNYNVNVGRSRNEAGADFKYVWATGEFNAGAGYGYDTYDFRPSTGGMTSFDRSALKFNMDLSSAHEEDNSIYYDFSVAYRKTGALHDNPYLVEDPVSMRENRLTFGGIVGTSFEVHRVYVDMSIDYSSYDAIKNYTLGVVEFSPMYEYKHRGFSGKFGVKFGNHFGIPKEDGSEPADGNDLEPWSNMFPQVDARLCLVRKYLWLRGVVTGGNDMNAYSDLLSKAPYLSPDVPLLFGSRPLDASLTLESVVFGRMAFNLSGAFSMVRNNAVFAPVLSSEPIPSEDSDNCPPPYSEPLGVSPHYMDINRLSVNLEAFWKSADITTGGEFRYNWYFSPDNLSTNELPAVKARYYARYSWKERVIASAEFNYRSAIAGDPSCWYADGVRISSGAAPVTYSVPAITTLDADVNYVVSDHLMVYVKAGNILNSRNQYVPLYIEPGFNIGAGLTVTF